MVAYHPSNAILVDTFQTIKYQHRIAAYNSIMQLLNNIGLTTDLKNLDNEEIQNYKATIKDKWGMNYQLVPTDIHRRNAAKWAIHTFKAHLLAVLSGGGS